MADLWIHEGFCTYSEALYVECLYGYETAQAYVNAKKPGVENKAPMIGPYDVNAEVSSDIYDKGMLLLNTLRHVVQDAQGSDDAWFALIRGITTDFERKVVSSAELEAYMARSLGMDLQAIFDQYLRQPKPPVLEYRQVAEGKASFLEYRWNAAVESFAMPIRYRVGEQTWQPLHPTTSWQRLPLNKKAKKAGFSFDEGRYYYLLEQVR
jgi:aminopeptidase N